MRPLVQSQIPQTTEKLLGSLLYTWTGLACVKQATTTVGLL